MTYKEIKDRLTKCESTLTSLKAQTIQTKAVENQIKTLALVKESLHNKLTLLEGKAKTYLVTPKQGETTAVSLGDDDIDALKDADDVKTIKGVDGEEIKEEVGDFTVDQTKAIAKQVGAAVAKALKIGGEEVASMKGKNIEENSFDIYVQYKNNSDDAFSFHIEKDKLILADFTFSKEMGEVGIKPSGEAIVMVDVIADNLNTHFKSLNTVGEQFGDNQKGSYANKQIKNNLERRKANTDDSDVIAKIDLALSKLNEIDRLNISKSFFIEVSIRTARKALMVLDDMFRGQFETEGSNYYTFANEQDGYDAGIEMASQGIELEDTNIEGLEEDAVFDGDDEAAETDYMARRRATDDYKEGPVREGPYQTTYVKVGQRDYKKAMAILDGNIDPTYATMDIVDDDGDGNVIIYFNFRAKDDGEPGEDVGEFIYDLSMDLEANGITVTGKSHDVDEAVDLNDPVLMKLRAQRSAKNNKTNREAGISPKKKAILDKLISKRAQVMRDMEQEAEPEGGPIADKYGSILNKIDLAIAKASGRKQMSYDDAIKEDDSINNEDTDVGHQDDEPSMLKSSAMETAEYAAKLYKKLNKYDQHDGEVDFPHWWQKKLVLAREYISAAYHYLDSEEKQPAIDQLALENTVKEQSCKVGDTLTKDGRKGKVIKHSETQATVDFGNGDVYGIAHSRIKNGKILNEGRGDMESIINLIRDKAGESGFTEQEEAMEVMEAIGEHYEISFEFGRLGADLEEGQGNEKAIKGQELVDYIMSNWNWSEEKTLHWLGDNFGKNKKPEPPKEQDQGYIDYLRRSGRNEYADELVARSSGKLKETEHQGSNYKWPMSAATKARKDADVAAQKAKRKADKFAGEDPKAGSTIKGTGFNAPRVKKKKGVEEKKRPGLWANINAKKKRGAKASHGNSNAHKDAVAAGNAMKKEADISKMPHKLLKEYGSNDIDELTGAIGYRHLDHFFEDNPGATQALQEWLMDVPEFENRIEDAFEDDYRPSISSLIEAIGYDDYDQFFDDNPGAVETIADWILSISDFVNKLASEFTTDELENFGLYDIDGYDSEDNEDELDESSINKIQKGLDTVEKHIQTHLDMYKSAEGKQAKALAVQMLKKLNKQKKFLIKSLDDKVASTGSDQTLASNSLLDMDEAGPGFAHDCAAKVVHETYGKGNCIPEKHTLVKEGKKYIVTHYDVLFENGKTVQDIPVDKLDIKTTNEHWHKGYKKKKK